MTVQLSSLGPGEKGRVTGFRGSNPAFQRIRSMGVTTGALVEVERVAPMGDPVELKVRGYHLSLRKDELEGIKVEVISE